MDGSKSSMRKAFLTMSMKSTRIKRTSSGRESTGSADSNEARHSTISNLSEQGNEDFIEAALKAKKNRGKEKKRRREVYDAPLEVTSRKGTLLSMMPTFSIPKFTKAASDEALIREALQRNIMLQDLTEQGLRAITEAMKPKKVSKGTELIKQGDIGEHFYIVQKGSFWFRKDGKNVGVANVGESFGELALLYDVSRAVSVISIEDSQVLQLDRKTFREIMITTNFQKTQMIKESLRKVPLFAEFTDEQIEKLADSVELLNFKKGARIIEKGSKASVIYFLKRGSVRCTSLGDDASEELDRPMDVILDKEGEHFGERPLLSDEDVRVADVYAHTDCEVFALDHESFEAMFGSLREMLNRNMAFRVLKSVPILHDLDKKSLDALLNHMEREEFPPKHTIIQQGVEGKKFYIIQDGKVEIIKHTKGSNNAPETAVKITELQTGDYFGEGSLLNNKMTNAEVKTLSNVVAFSLGHDAFRDLLEKVHARIEKEFKNRENQTEDEMNRTVTAIESKIKFDDLEVIRVLGRGTFGVVKMVQHKHWKTTYALKVLQKDQIVKFKQQKNVMTEKNVMLKARHPFVLKLYKTFKDRDCLYMLLELIQGGELFNLLRLHGGRISGRRARFYASCVLDALLYLHDMDIVYRDLKPENLLIDAQGYIRVVDFGFAKKITTKSYTLCGTPEYLAPELVLQKPHDRSIDYWALGILIYEMLEGHSPFADPQMNPEDEQDYQKTVFNNIVRGNIEFTERFSSAGKSIVKKLLRQKPSERLGMRERGGDEIREHKWFSKLDWEFLRKKEVEAPWVPEIKGATDAHYFEEDDEEEERIVKYKVKDDTGWDKDF